MEQAIAFMCVFYLFLICFKECVKFGNVEILKLLFVRNKENTELLNNNLKVKEELWEIMGTLITDAIYSDEFRHCAEGIESFYFRLCLSRENSILKSDERKGYVQKQLENI